MFVGGGLVGWWVGGFVGSWVRGLVGSWCAGGNLHAHAAVIKL
jgi:hypothetical protein